MAVLKVYRGLPGCGKTTTARAQQAGGSRGTVAIVNRDDIRRDIFGTTYWPDCQEFEDRVTEFQLAMIRHLFEIGVDLVICDDTNLYREHAQRLIDLAKECGADYAVRDMTNVSLADCIGWDLTRTPDQQVGAQMIYSMWKQHIEGQPYPLPL